MIERIKAFILIDSFGDVIGDDFDEDRLILAFYIF